MQGEDKIKETQDLLMEKTIMYSKMYRLGLCAISEFEGSHKIILENPGVPLTKFINSVNLIWPEIRIEYIDKNFPYEILLTPETRDDGIEYYKDFTDVGTLKFSYNPNIISSFPNFIDLVLSEWFNFVHQGFLKIYRDENYSDGMFPIKWPHDVIFRKVVSLIYQIMGYLFLNLDWNSFNLKTSDFFAMILYQDISYINYIPEDLLKEIERDHLTIRSLINEFGSNQ
jgi:hypothetical protein